MGLLSIIFRIGADATGFKVGMKQAESQAAIAGKKIAGYMAGAFSVAAIVQMGKALVEYGSQLTDMSERLKISTDDLQKLDYAAKQSGSSMEALALAAARLGKVRGAILSGGGEKEGAILGKMGIDREKLQQQSVMETMMQVSEFIKNTDLGADEGAVMQALFGRSGESLIPVFKSGLKEMGDEAERLHGIMRSGVVKSLDDMGDAFDKVKFSARGMFSELLAGYNKYSIAVAQNAKDALKRGDVFGAINPVGVYKAMKGREKQDAVMASIPAIMAGIFPGRGSSAAGGSIFGDILGDKDKDTGPTFTESIQSRQAGQGSLAHVGGFFGLGGTKDASVSYLKRIERNTGRAAKAAEDLAEEGY